MPETQIDKLWQARFGGTEAAPSERVLDQAACADTVRLLLRHRTHRAYINEPINEETLNAVLGCALSAPSKSDLQQLSIVVIDEPQLREKFAAMIPTMPWIKNAAAFLVFLADGHRIESLCAHRGKPFANDNLDNFLAAVSDASLALQNAITGAEALGLGCCPISVIRDHMSEVANLLTLPRRVVPLAGL
ncbi:MAG: nitroreductase family protein, partial [Pseudomonadales bacterium]